LNLKKFTALLLAALLCLSLCGCSGSSKSVGVVTAPDGTEYTVSRGLYRMVQLTALAVAATDVDPDGEMTTEELLAASYQGTTVRAWVEDRVEQGLVRYMVVEQLFNEHNGAFTDVEMYYYKSVIDDTWNMYDKLYVSNDVDRDGFSSYQYNMLREFQLPLLLCAEDGPLQPAAADVNAFAETSVAAATYIAIGTSKADGTSLSPTETIAAAEMAGKLCEDAAAMGMDAAWEANKLDVLKLLGMDVTTEESPVRDGLFAVGAGLFSDALVEEVLAIPVGESRLCTEADGSLFAVMRTELSAEDDEALREQYILAEGDALLADYLAEAVKGWSFTLSEKAAERYSPDSITFE